MGISRTPKLSTGRVSSGSPRRRVGLEIVVAAIAVFCLVITVASAKSSDSRAEVRGATYGFAATNALLGSSDSEIDSEMDAMVAVGATWVKVGVHWNGVERVPGIYDWAVPDRIVAAAKRHNLKILGIIAGGAPIWSATPTIVGITEAPPADPQRFGDFARIAAARYAGAISTWEIWNEPNNPRFFPPAPNVPAYAVMLRAAYLAIHSAAPGATVLSGGLAPTSAGAAVPPGVFMRDLYAAGAGRYFDGVAMHPYTFPFSIDSDPNAGWSTIGVVHQVMADNGDGAKKIWITEFGAPTGTSPVSMSEQAQASLLVDAISRAKSTPYIAALFIYTIRDTGVDPSNAEQNFGIQRRDFTQKAAFHVLVGDR